MLKVMVELNKQRSTPNYPISIGAGLLALPESYAPLKAGDKVMIVSNPTIAQHYLSTVTKALEQLGCSQIDSVLLPDGEQFKTLESLNLIFSALLEKNHHRNSVIIALGGGVVGDMAGYAAASYQRGIRFLQIPTTLLAQVDSSVGGKTGVNHSLGKNMIGAFHQPIAVIIDTNTLHTLPKREFCSGLAEVIKYGAILDVNFFKWLENHIDDLLTLNQPALEFCIQRCCQLKADIVAEDEKEQGKRALLNFGHTYGHAVESHLGYGNWLHGEAIAVGMLEASVLSNLLGYMTQQEIARLEKLLIRAVLPTVSPEGMQPQDYLSYMWRDKKMLTKKLRLVLLKTLGQAYINADVSEELVVESIARCSEVSFFKNNINEC
ncbi:MULTISPECIES: 3-dehydroquinate synthase [Pasteurellaceae]|uniref:3-dehydroquinate synthase n=1 Tax=Pasteurella atlantica TaxID=2827233 RepID=A0AAW8CUJ6_9PAST|nr:3-dehydroquinate synthase [Pasteurella atlantica]MBR0574502.1 3-dehydroquinate synthase [Pasteurella atlantica]MDP8040359.1 3-dehydroquinate synthase [Pasteurella atlantica]MDP8042410.1 3-dehydroquinate synthase [Pasteurella atlantica]MDP8044629.1 3-dehydroquinate synthase [Pasteurella atlantica]MDP8046688.1 3-dehydroquinate synthase [Pasteurella atlantica]